MQHVLLFLLFDTIIYKYFLVYVYLRVCVYFYRVDSVIRFFLRVVFLFLFLLFLSFFFIYFILIVFFRIVIINKHYTRVERPVLTRNPQRGKGTEEYPQRVILHAMVGVPLAGQERESLQHSRGVCEEEV